MYSPYLFIFTYFGFFAPTYLLLGEASYSLYITHFGPVIALNQAREKGVEIGVIWVAITIVLSIITSIGFLKFVEIPARRAIRDRKPMRFT